MMRQMDSGAPFCEVCSEAIVKSLYDKINLVGSVSPITNLVIVAPTNPLTFSVAPLLPSTHSLSVQWSLEGKPIDGATNTSCDIAFEQLSNSICQLTAKVSDATALVRSDPSNLLSQTVRWTVVPFGIPIKATITTSPQAARVHLGDAAQLSVVSGGTEPLSYQWYVSAKAKTASGVAIEGAQSPVLDIANAQPTNGAYYFVVVTNVYGSATSVPVALTLSVPFQVVCNGPGKVTPNYDGQWLNYGSNYTVTASPSNRCVFSNWTGAASSKTAKLTFTVGSSLVLTANFGDRISPALTIASPQNNARLTSSEVLLTGKATDNLTITNVMRRVNGGEWLPVLTTNSWTNWFALISPLPGTNLVEIWAMDAVGNAKTLSRKFTWVVMQPIGLSTNGVGKLSMTNGQLLELAKAYSITATPGAGQLFAGWCTGSRSKTLSFVMESNLFFTATFVTNPFINLKGNYGGLYQTADVPSLASSGGMKLTLTESGAFTGKLLGIPNYSFSGSFGIDGASSLTATLGKQSVALNLALDVSNGTRHISGTITGSNWTAQAQCDLATANAVAPGVYTVDLAPPSRDGSFGDGYGKAIVSASGSIAFTGVLSDGTPVSQSSYVSKDGLWPFFVTPYAAKNGWLVGKAVFTNTENASLTGEGTWLRTATKSGFQTNGFTNQVFFSGSPFTVLKTRALALTNANFILSGGGLDEALTNSVIVNSNNKVSVVSGTNKLSLKLNPSTGFVTGSLKHPVTHSTVSLRGILFQQEPSARGYFLMGKTNSGSFVLEGE
jgi:hypothetical protein